MAADSHGHAWPWPTKLQAVAAQQPSRARTASRAVAALAMASRAANPAGEETAAEEQRGVPRHYSRGGEGAML